MEYHFIPITAVSANHATNKAGLQFRTLTSKLKAWETNETACIG